MALRQLTIGDYRNSIGQELRVHEIKSYYKVAYSFYCTGDSNIFYSSVSEILTFLNTNSYTLIKSKNSFEIWH